MKRGKLVGILFSFALILGIVVGGCAQPAPTAPTAPTPTPSPTPTKVYELTFASIHPPENAMNKYIYRGWFDEIEAKSGGRIKVTIVPGSQAAAPFDHFDAARTGIVEMSCQLMTMAPGRFPLTEVITLPGLFGWPSSMPTALTGMAMAQKYPELAAEFEGTKIINFHATGAHQIYPVDKPVYTMEDMKNMVIQCFGTYEAMAIAELGGTPEALNVMEAYDALAKGVVDGIATSTEGHVIWGWYEVCKHGVGSDLTTDLFAHVMNQKTWDSLPPDLQELFVGENAERWSTLLAYQFDRDEITYRQLISESNVAKGGTEFYVLPDAEAERWTAAKKVTWEAWVEQAAAKIGEAKARSILEDALKLGAQYSYKTYTPTVNDWAEKQIEDWGYEWGTSGRPGAH